MGLPLAITGFSSDDAGVQVVIINPRRACAARVTVLGLCVCVCLSVCLSVTVCLMDYFSDLVSLHVEMKVPTASVRHGAEYYKKGFRCKRFIQKLWASFAYRGLQRC